MFSFKFYSVHFLGYNLTSAYRFQFRLEINKPFLHSFFLLEVGRSYHSMQF
jgi:hypothetical protein